MCCVICSLLAGRLSDYLIKRTGNNGGAVGQRVRVVMGYLVGVAASLLALKYVPAGQALLQVRCWVLRLVLPNTFIFQTNGA